MQCEQIRPVIRKFLDDLLAENDYQEVQQHLNGCAHCHAYANSVGTLSIRLHQLGQVSLPPDMVSMVLFELKKPRTVPVVPKPAPPKQDTPVAEAFTDKTRYYWMATAAFIALSLGATAFVVANWRPDGKTPAFDTVVRPAASSASAPLGGGVQITPQPLNALTPAPSTERHYHVSPSSRSEVEQIARELGMVQAVEPTARAMVYDGRPGTGPLFQSRIENISGVVKEYGEHDAVADASSVRISIYFE